jgi:hypothetical protein
MKKRRLIFFLLAASGIVVLDGCRNAADTSETDVRSVVPVTVCVPRTGRMAEYEELTATSSYLVKAVLKSPVTGYVEQCGLNPGDPVAKNRVIFKLRTKEAAALEGDSLASTRISGIVTVKASIDGVVASVDHPQGDYIQEGDPLCTLVHPESLVFLLDVPFELKAYVRTGSQYILSLPDNTRVKATISSVLPSMSGASQTQRVILKPDAFVSLPENLIARVRIAKAVASDAVILPKSSVLTDEVMKQFWVMKLVNDTLAVRVSVTVGITGNDSVQVLTPVFGATDRILTSGNYGIGDTAVVRIIKND